MKTPTQAFKAAATSPTAAKRVLAAVKDYAKLCKSQEKPVPAHLQAVLGLEGPALLRAIEKDIARWSQDHFAGLHAAWTDAVPLIAARLPVLLKKPGSDWYGRPEFLLSEAAIHGSAEVIAWLVENGADVNARDDAGGHGHTALHWAVYQLQPGAVKALCAAPGIDFSKTSKHGDTALALALTRGPKDALSLGTLILKAGANPNDGGTRSPLAIAVTTRKVDVVKRLLAAKEIEVDAIDRKTGATALQLAAAFGVEEAAALLLEAGADRSLVTKRKLEGTVLRLGGKSGMKVEKKSYAAGLTASKLAKAAGLAALAKRLS